jgi:hypothetical protein
MVVLLNAVNGNASGFPPGAKLHEPVPTAIELFPARVTVVPQKLWSTPALEAVGVCCKLIVTLLALGVQVPLLIVQVKA